MGGAVTIRSFQLREYPRDCSPILPESLTQKSMKSRRVIRFPRRLRLLRRMRADDAFHTRKTDFEPSKRRRLSRYQIGALQTAHLCRTDVNCGLGMSETRVQTTHVLSETT